MSQILVENGINEKPGSPKNGRSCSCALLLNSLHHVNRFPRTILRAKLASNADFFVDYDYSVYAYVAVFFGILGAGDLIKTIHRTKFDANLASGASFRMNDGNNR